MATNEYGFDYRYFERRLLRMLQDIELFTPEEAYNEFSRMAETVRPKEIESLRAKLSEAEKDAERYQTLRNAHWSDGLDVLCVVKARDAKLGSQTYSQTMLDDAIAKQKGEQ